MQVPAAQLTADRDRQFDDWGETVTFRQITQTYDPQTQQVSEAKVDTQLVAIVGRAPAKPANGTAAQHLNFDISFLIKAEELPTSTPETTSRIVYAGGEYDVLKFHRSGGGLLYALDCRKTS